MCLLSQSWNFYKTNFLAMKSHKSFISECGRWKHVENYFHDCPLTEISGLKIIDFKNQLFKSKLSPQSIRHCLSLLQRVIRKSHLMGLYNGQIPIFDMPHFDNRRLRFLSKPEAQDLLQNLQSTSSLWHDIAFLGLMTGLRAGEIFNLSPANFDNCNKLLHIFDCKSNLNRTIPLNTPACKILTKYCFQKQAHDFLFTNKNNQKIKEVSKIFFSTIKKTNLKYQSTLDRRNKIVFHTLRHSFASWLVQDGVALAVISQLLGHSNIQMTMRYAHLAPQLGRDAVKKLEF